MSLKASGVLVLFFGGLSVLLGLVVASVGLATWSRHRRAQGRPEDEAAVERGRTFLILGAVFFEPSYGRLGRPETDSQPWADVSVKCLTLLEFRSFHDLLCIHLIAPVQSFSPN